MTASSACAGGGHASGACAAPPAPFRCWQVSFCPLRRAVPGGRVAWRRRRARGRRAGWRPAGGVHVRGRRTAVRRKHPGGGHPAAPHHPGRSAPFRAIMGPTPESVGFVCCAGLQSLQQELSREAAMELNASTGDEKFWDGESGDDKFGDDKIGGDKFGLRLRLK